MKLCRIIIDIERELGASIDSNLIDCVGRKKEIHSCKSENVECLLGIFILPYKIGKM